MNIVAFILDFVLSIFILTGIGLVNLKIFVSQEAFNIVLPISTIELLLIGKDKSSTFKSFLLLGIA